VAGEDRKADRFGVNRGSDRNAGPLSDGSAESAPVPPVPPVPADRTLEADKGVKAGLGEAPRGGRSFEGFRPDAVPGWGEPAQPRTGSGTTPGAATAANGPEAGAAPDRGGEPVTATGTKRADKIRFLGGMLGAGREQGRRGRQDRPADDGGQELPANAARQNRPAGPDVSAAASPNGRPVSGGSAASTHSSAAVDSAAAPAAGPGESRDAALKKAARLAAGGSTFGAASSNPATPGRAGDRDAGTGSRAETGREEIASAGTPSSTRSEGAPSMGTPVGTTSSTRGEGAPSMGTPSSSAAGPSGVTVGASGAGVAAAAAVAAQVTKAGPAGKPDKAASLPQAGEPTEAGTGHAVQTGDSARADLPAQTGNSAQTDLPAQSDLPGPVGEPGPAGKPNPAYQPGHAAKGMKSHRASKDQKNSKDLKKDKAPKDATLDEANPATGSLSIRPPRSEVIKRANQREEALRAKPLAGRILQVVLAACFPFLLLIGAIRLVCTPLFLWAEYNRPGFPADSFGFSTDDRMTYGSYAVDYLLNWAGPRYLGGLMGTDGRQLFLDTEVGHMADVKTVIMGAWIAGIVLLVLAAASAIYLARRYPGGIRRGLFAGSVATVLLIVVLGVLGALNWQLFFTEFHRIFFAEGTWTFFTDDTLIRLFPGQFWMDAGVVIALLVFVVSSLVMAFSWPTKSRRVRSSEKLAATRARYMGEPEDRERI
jgi:integral membrane protein (TIGR01906 family)